MLNSLVLGELGRSVDTVVVAGEVVLEHGRSTRIDEDQLWQQTNDVVQRSLAQLPARQEFLEERLAYVQDVLAAVDRAPGGPRPPLS
jgi:hypothetical protein